MIEVAIKKERWLHSFDLDEDLHIKIEKLLYEYTSCENFYDSTLGCTTLDIDVNEYERLLHMLKDEDDDIYDFFQNEDNLSQDEIKTIIKDSYRILKDFYKKADRTDDYILLKINNPSPLAVR